MARDSQLPIKPEDDRLLAFQMLAGRWNCHRQVAAQRAKELGLPLIRFNGRVVCVRLSDILKAEEAAAV